MRTRIWASIVVVAFVVPLLAAQVDFGAINGVVTDSSGAVLPGVTIELTGPEKRTVLTGGRGEFSVVRLRPGEYNVLITLAGFSTVRTKVVLAAGRTERLTIQMRVGAVEETVTVTGETPRVDTQSAAPQFRTSCRWCRRSSPGRPTGGLQHRGVRPHRGESIPSRRGRSALDVLDRRGHRVVRQRAAVPHRWDAAARRRRPHRRAGQLFPLRLSTAIGERAVLDHHRAHSRARGIRAIDSR